MSKGVYLGVDGYARKVKSMYIGVDGVARKIKLFPFVRFFVYISPDVV